MVWDLSTISAGRGCLNNFFPTSRFTMWRLLSSNGLLILLVSNGLMTVAKPMQFYNQMVGGQGAALMPALFCLAMRPALEYCRAAVPDGSLAVSHQDGIFIVRD